MVNKKNIEDILVYKKLLNEDNIIIGYRVEDAVTIINAKTGQSRYTIMFVGLKELIKRWCVKNDVSYGIHYTINKQSKESVMRDTIEYRCAMSINIENKKPIYVSCDSFSSELEAVFGAMSKLIGYDAGR
tara:strand:- start:794 stop:1183 length:390 start_codon:yes stop_codon:yes gene_type:complete